MNYQLLLISLFIYSFAILPVQACPSGNPESTDYIRRDQNRCEGIQARDIAGGFRLISVATSSISSYPNPLTLLIPRLGKDTPEVEIESLEKNYLLNDLSLLPSSYGFTFQLKPNILNKVNIAPSTLRGLASVDINSQRVYLPVTIGKPAKKYQFVFYSSYRTKFPTFEIRHNGKIISSQSRNIDDDGEIVFTWDGSQAPAGRYEVHIIAEQEPINERPEKIERHFYFEHNPKWLK